MSYIVVYTHDMLIPSYLCIWMDIWNFILRCIYFTWPRQQHIYTTVPVALQLRVGLEPVCICMRVTCCNTDAITSDTKKCMFSKGKLTADLFRYTYDSATAAACHRLMNRFITASIIAWSLYPYNNDTAPTPTETISCGNLANQVNDKGSIGLV